LRHPRRAEMRRIAVVGHVEWVDILPVRLLPRAESGLLTAHDASSCAAGSAVTVAAVLAELGAQVDFFCALGSDERGRHARGALSAMGIHVHASVRPGHTRRAVAIVHPREHLVVASGTRHEPRADDDLPWHLLESAEAIFVTGGDAGVISRARTAPVLIATPRAQEGVATAAAKIDVLVFSERDPTESALAGQLASLSSLLVATDAERGGRWYGASEGRWSATALPGTLRNQYGCGDAFAAGLAFGLASGSPIEEAVRLGARCGAVAATRTGGYSHVTSSAMGRQRVASCRSPLRGNKHGGVG